MRLNCLYEEKQDTSEIFYIADFIESASDVLKQYPRLPAQLRELSNHLNWKNEFSPDQRLKLSQKMAMRLGTDFHDRSAQLEQLQANRQYNREELEEATHILRSKLSSLLPGLIVKARTKSESSIAKKLKSDDYKGKGLGDIKDIIGARVLCSTYDKLGDVAHKIEHGFKIYRKRNFFRDNDERPLHDWLGEDDYFGINYLVEVDGWSAEIQLSVTALEPWNDLQHVLIYKPAVELDEDLSRRLAIFRDNLLWHVFMGQK